MRSIFETFVLFPIVSAFVFKTSILRSRYDSSSSSSSKNLHLRPLTVKYPPPMLMPDPQPNSIGNFFDNKTDEMAFIQCYMTSMCKINGSQYGVGFPVDMPVMLTFFEGNELKPVRPDYPDYDHLVNHVSVQMDYNDFQLYKTPVVLTLQGEFEDEFMNEILPTPRYKKGNGIGVRDKEEDMEEDDGEEEEDDDWEEVTVDELVQLEGIDEDEDDEDLENEEEDEDEDDDDEDDETDDDDDDNENANMSSFWKSSPAGKLDEKYRNQPDYMIFRPENPDISDIPADAFVTDEDSVGLRKAHKRADRIMEYATDVALIASFHYKKKNFHLVKLLEPIFIIGRRIEDIKGYYFTLLSDEEGDKMAPVIEKLVLEKAKATPKPQPEKPEDWRKRSRRSRRRWTSRQKDQEEKPNQ